MPKTIIEITDLQVAYEKKTVLHDINLKIYERDFLGIIGPNGGGKTTLIKCILGLKQPSKGKILYNGSASKNALTIGYLPQYSTIDKKFPISVDEVICSGLSGKKKPGSKLTAEDRQQCARVVEEMGLKGLEKRAIGQLSGGQLQRTLLGRAMVSNPQLLILDEPNTYIDKRYEARLYELLAEINKTCAIVLISHDIGTVLQQVKSIACVNETLDYHPDTDVKSEWLEQKFNCPIELLGHGALPHRVLANHHPHD